MPDKAVTHVHTRTARTIEMAVTWQGDHQGRPSAPLYIDRQYVDFMAHYKCNNNYNAVPSTLAMKFRVNIC